MMKEIAVALLLGFLIVDAPIRSAGAKEKEETVTLADVPPAVRTAIETESRGGELKKIERVTKKKKVVYELELLKGGQELEVVIAEDGTVLKRKIEKGGK
jgi:uncharacterized membrane protein YkoI